MPEQVLKLMHSRTDYPRRHECPEDTSLCHLQPGHGGPHLSPLPACLFSACIAHTRYCALHVAAWPTTLHFGHGSGAGLLASVLVAGAGLGCRQVMHESTTRLRHAGRSRAHCGASGVPGSGGSADRRSDVALAMIW